MTDRTAPPLGALAAEPTFHRIDGLSIRFVESDRRDADELHVVDAGHFIWEDAAGECAPLVQGGPRGSRHV
jgi:hypothetical protein